MNPFKKQQSDLEWFTIQDTKVGNYWSPTLAINRFDMIRQIEHTLREDKTNRLTMNPEDYALIKIGEYDRKTGTITPCAHEHICNITDLAVQVRQTYGSQQQALSST